MSSRRAVKLQSDHGHTSELQIAGVKLIAGTSFIARDTCPHTFLYSSGRAVSEKYFHDGKRYRDSKCI